MKFTIIAPQFAVRAAMRTWLFYWFLFLLPEQEVLLVLFHGSASSTDS